MNALIYHFILSLILLIFGIFYLRIAKKFGIVDVPNKRSSHQITTVRGGGIIVPVAVILYYFIFGFQSTYFVLGLVIIAIISFFDDVMTLGNKSRILVQLIAVAFMFYQLNFIEYQWWLVFLAFIVIAGAINAINFMDGINGITVAYAIVCICSIGYLSHYHNVNIDTQLLVSVLLGLLVFGFYNFRSKAICFAGDVGSVSVALIMCYLLTQVIIATNNISFILFLAVYGIDTVLTIIQRLWRRENIFKAHRLHLFQYLVNEKRHPHLLIATVYAILQLTINVLVIYNFQHNLLNSWMMILSVLTVLGGVYILLKWNIHNKYYA